MKMTIVRTTNLRDKNDHRSHCEPPQQKRHYNHWEPLAKGSLSDDILGNRHGWAPPRYQHRTRHTGDRYRIKSRHVVAPSLVTGRSISKQHEEGFERDFN